MSRFAMTKDQQDLKNLAAEFGRDVLRAADKLADETGETPLDVYRQMVEIGFADLSVPKEFGGLGMDLTTEAIINEELSRWGAGITNSIGATTLGIKPILIAGNPEQKQRAADMIRAGHMAAFGLTEPDAGSDAAAQKTFAKKVDGGYVLNGRKCFITNAPYADLFVIFAMTKRGVGHRGISAFIVEGDRPGLSRGPHEKKMGLRGAAAGDVILEDVFVPDENLLGEEGKGFKLAMQTLDASRVIVGISAVGIAQSAIDHSVEYAKNRICFGKPIANLQAIQFMLADMEIQTQAARSLCYAAAEAYDNGKPFSKLAAAAKCMGGDTAMKVTTDAVQILSGYGYMRDYPVEKLMRDAKLFQIFEGTNQVQRVVVASNLLK